jgi:uncharacterized protein YegL
MNGTVPVILSTDPVTRENRNKSSRPHIAVVYADADGNLERRDSPPSWWSAGRRYQTRYEVDLTVHRRKARMDNTRLPSKSGLYYFDAEVDITFQVTDPLQIVKDNVSDVLPIVYGHLVQTFWPVTRAFEINDYREAEDELNRLFPQPIALPEGITIIKCFARLFPDAKAQQHLLDIDAAQKSIAVGKAQHEADKAAARHQNELAAINQDARLDAESREHAAMADRPVDVRTLIQAHLAKHPEETAFALEMLSRHEAAIAEKQDINDKRSMDLIRYMIEQGLLQPVDVQMLRNQALGRMQEITSPAPRPAAPAGRPNELLAGKPTPAEGDSWNEPLPGGSPPIVSLKPEPQTAAGADASAGAKPAKTVPVYLIVDESPADPGYFDALNDSIRTLPAELAADAKVIDAIRLAVVGYGDEVDVRMPLNAVAADSYVPDLRPRPGSRLGLVFDYLRERIDEDVARNKSRGLLVGRPVIYLLCASTPADNPAWQEAYQRLTDRDQFRAAPNIVACGVGEADPAVIKTITSHPHSRGWLADSDMPLGEAAARYAAFIRRGITALARAHVTGKADAVWEDPDGFRPADGPV